MKWTNDLSLPLPLYAAITTDTYTIGAKADYSTTQILKPPRIVALTRKWKEHLVEDVSDSIFSLLGRSIHTILERAASDRYIVEQRYYAEFNGFVLAGQIDVYDQETQTLSDYKLCSRFVAADGIKPEWIAQQSINRLLMYRDKGIVVKAAQNVCIFRDWSKMQAGRSHDYPQRQVVVLNVPLWPSEQTEQFINERIAMHEAARTVLPDCTNEDKWQKPDRFALMKKGAKKAVKLYDTREEAEAAVSDPKHFVEPRNGEPVRCLNYCSVNKYCSFYQGMMQEQL